MMLQAEGIALVEQYVLSMYKDLGLIPSTRKEGDGGRKQGRKKGKQASRQEGRQASIT